MTGLLLNNDQLNELFPFHFILENSLKVVQAGKSMLKLCPDIIGKPFQAYFKFKRPAFEIKYTFESIASYANQVFIFELHKKNESLYLRGQVVVINDTLLFVGSPWVVESSDFDKHNLLIKDFAIHDPVTDMVQLLKAKQLSLEDIQILAEDLKKQRDELVKKNREVEDLAKFPSEDPNPILRVSLSQTIRYSNFAAEDLLHQLGVKVGDHLPVIFHHAFSTAIGKEEKVETILTIEEKEYNFLLVPFVDSGYLNVYGVDITDKRRTENRVKESEKRLKIQYTIAELLSSSTESLQDTLNKIIEKFCNLTGWDCGLFWMLTKSTFHAQELMNISYWQSPQIAGREFETLTKQIKFTKGIGLPGRIWETGKYCWIQDVTNDTNFPRIQAARKTGFHGAFGYPIFLNNTFLGVIEFFSNKVHEPNMDIIEMFEASSKQIAQYIIRKQSEDLIRESEEKYKLLVEEASDIIYRTDTNGNFTYINSIAERIMRINKQQLIGRHFTYLVRADWKEKTEQFYMDQFKNRVSMTYFEFPVLGSGNREIWIGQNVRLVTEGNKVKGFHAVARDVSEKVRAQQELKKNEEKYRGIIENLDLGILEVDTEGTIIKAYEKYCQLTGYSEKELIGKKANLILLDPEQQNIMDLENNKRLNGDSSVYEIRLNCKGGAKKWVLIFSFISNDTGLTILFITFIGATIGFLRFNLGKNKIFMGDAGSLFIGNILVNSSLYLLNKNVTLMASNPLLLFVIIGFLALPVLDSLRVYLSRLKKGNSPFKADKTHLHHLILLIDSSHRRVSIVISIISICILLFTVLIQYYVSITMSLILVVLTFSLLGLFLNLNKKVFEWRERVKKLEDQQ